MAKVKKIKILIAEEGVKEVMLPYTDGGGSVN